MRELIADYLTDRDRRHSTTAKGQETNAIIETSPAA
jgi:hypothetical protein